MPRRTGQASITILIVSALLIAATVLFAVLLVRSAPEMVTTAAPVGADAAGRSPAPTRGVRAVLTAGDVTVQRQFAALSLHLEPGQTLDAGLPAGAFIGRFRLGFSAGPVRYARLGAWVQGGSLIVRRHDRMIADDYGGDEPRLVLSTEPHFLGSRVQEIEYELASDGRGPVSLRAVWQPEGAQVPLPLPGDGSRLLADPVDRGLVAVQELNCVACHRSADPDLQALAAAAPAPDLREIGARARPGWLGFWLSIPDRLRPGTAMPRLFRVADIEEVMDVVHFLAMRGGPLPEDEAAIDAGPIATGRFLYEQVGCVPCHGPLEGTAPTASGGASFSELPDLAAKTTVEALTAFLLDPRASRPSGLMPSLALDETEARAIASYLISLHDAPDPVRFTPDPVRAARGRASYAARGCAGCHEREGEDAIVSTLPAPPLESANPAAPGGCLAAEPYPGVPRFVLTPARRADVTAFLESLPARRSHDVPHQRVAATMDRMMCLSCHTWYGAGGPDSVTAPYFTTEGEADLGDEGRLPPDLSNVGARLEGPWIRQVLEEAARARPYLATRMPQYGAANVGHLRADFAAVAGVGPGSDAGPAFDVDAAAVGRELVGAGGLNCIQCHDIAGRDATGTPGPDLAQMAERLRYEGYARWLHDPSLTRPGTRMPSFFVGGRSAFTQYFGGDAVEQIRAIWCYLAQGEMLALPEGLVDPQGLALDVTGEDPFVFRTFMEDAGVRAIACGFPEQVHCAFDADHCRLAAAWQGPFLNARGAWAARGGTETNPEEIAWTAPPRPVFGSGDPESPWTHRFLGYRLDEQRRPIFQYELRRDGQTVRVTEQPVPHRDGLDAWFVRRFELWGPAGTRLIVDGGEQRGPFDVILEAPGRGRFELEVRWEPAGDGGSP